MDSVCQNYASAFYSMLSPKEREDALAGLTLFVDYLNEEPKYLQLLSSYNLSSANKRDAIQSVFGKTLGSIPHLLPFLYIISDHHRIKQSPQILAAFRSLLNADIGVKEGLAYSAERLTKTQLSELEAAIGTRLGCRVALTNTVDSRLLGGVKVAVDGKVFDGTLSAKLQDLRRSLKGGTLS